MSNPLHTTSRLAFVSLHEQQTNSAGVARPPSDINFKINLLEGKLSKLNINNTEKMILNPLLISFPLHPRSILHLSLSSF